MSPSTTCDCGRPKAIDAVQCPACVRAAFKKLAKYAIAAGAILGLVCSSLPSKFQAACHAVSSVLSAC